MSRMTTAMLASAATCLVVSACGLAESPTASVPPSATTPAPASIDPTPCGKPRKQTDLHVAELPAGLRFFGSLIVEPCASKQSPVTITLYRLAGSKSRERVGQTVSDSDGSWSTTVSPRTPGDYVAEDSAYQAESDRVHVG